MTPVAYAVAEGTPQHARLQRRGDPANWATKCRASSSTCSAARRVAATDASGRLELAHWLTAAANPLTPRVIVNRVWQWHFGRGLVATPNDFGTRGAAPTHPELLDHLAAEFVQAGWRLKALHRRILLSATYQQASGGAAGARPRYDCLSAPATDGRGTARYAAGRQRRIGSRAGRGPSVPAGSHVVVLPAWPVRRRVRHAQAQRLRDAEAQSPQPFFALFDGPDPNASTPQRD